jgi:hypothetical protein
MYADMMGISDRVKYLDGHMKIISKYREDDGNLKDTITSNDMMRLQTPPTSPTKERQDNDIDNSKFTISRNLKAQRKLKIIDAD